MGTEADDEDFEGTASGSAPGKAAPERTPADNSRFKSRYLAEAEELGLEQRDFDECDDNTELLGMIANERSRQAHSRASAPARGRETRVAPEGTAAPTVTGKDAGTPVAPEPEEDWAVTDPGDDIAEPIKAEIKRLGKEFLKAKKAGDKGDRIEKLEKLVAEQQALLSQQQIRNSPIVRRGNAAIAAFKSVFGEVFDEDGIPPKDTDERSRHERLMRYLFGNGTDEYPRNYDDKATPEANVAKAMKKLWPKAAEFTAEPTEPEKKPGKPAPANRIADWNGSGQAVPTNRSGAKRTGIPDKTGKEARVAQRESGIADPDSDDDDM